MANTSIDLVGLDFQTIKSNFTTYLKNNSAFKDVDFEGSNINVLLDILAYNTYFNSFYTNMVASEMFIDSAQLRDSIVSHAKSLNYTPKSFTSAYATIALNITPSTSTNNVVIPKSTTFTSKVGSNTFTFSTSENLVLNQSNNGVFSVTLDIFEGIYVTDSFTMNYSNSNQRFVISNPTVDISSIDVTVIEDNGDNSISYKKTDTIIGLNSLSNVYFIEAAENQQYELRFGDNVFGRKPKDGSIIVTEYRTSSGELPNGASRFSNDGNIDGHSNVSITVVANASGGSINETIESVRYNAPRNFQVQGRAVTETDYEVILKSNFSDIENISAFGGETLDPPQFGKVFISVDVQNADGSPQNRIKVFSDFIRDKTPVSIDAVFVDPVFMYVGVDSSVKYNINRSNKSTADIKSLVISKISSHNLTNLNGFKKTLYYSKLLKDIDNADVSIVSNDTDVKAIKIIAPSLINHEVNFDFELAKETGVDLITEEIHYGHTITSSAFVYNGQRSILIDDTKGNLFIATITSNFNEINKQIGTVNYDIGKIIISNLSVDSYEGSGIKIYAKPKSKDFASSKNVILTIADEDIKVSVTPVKI